MTAVLELIQIVESAGGRFMVDEDRLGIVPGKAADPVMAELKAHKREIIALLVERGATIGRNVFEFLLAEAGHVSGEVCGVVLASGLMLREDG